MKVDRSGSVVLEYIICCQDRKSPVSEHVSLQELIAVSCWYIWWQRRELVNGGNIASPSSSAFSVNALAANFCAAKPMAKEKVCTWSKPSPESCKLNIDASFHSDGTGVAGVVL
jgi:hypothetical protein